MQIILWVSRYRQLLGLVVISSFYNHTKQEVTMGSLLVIIMGVVVLLLVLLGVWISNRQFNKMDKNPEEHRRPEEEERL
jgi:sensor histidine kinase regulating citrate/malate metabolism